MLSECAYNTMHLVNNVCISDMGLCGEVGNMDETRVYGVMPYMAPEILRGKPYTQAADIYSFGMIMYFVATGRQPFNDCAHDQYLALNICDGIRPEINEQGVPKFYVDLMKKCWDSNPENRPTANEIDKLTDVYNPEKGDEIIKQNDEADEYRKANILSIENSKLTTSTHPQAYYTSRLLNPFTKDLPKYDSDCLDCLIDQS
ncbi:kinase-like domain-containing protein [Rhizophagus diaphanus]|nr:kinase-like domain-containing protein [Rhizophagus diaphanus] [Rhizophagus sp. MUCL 43196]